MEIFHKIEIIYKIETFNKMSITNLDDNKTYCVRISNNKTLVNSKEIEDYKKYGFEFTDPLNVTDVQMTLKQIFEFVQFFSKNYSYDGCIVKMYEGDDETEAWESAHGDGGEEDEIESNKDIKWKIEVYDGYREH